MGFYCNNFLTESRKMLCLSAEPKLYLVLLFLCDASAKSWTGNMHPAVGFQPSCNISNLKGCAPSYEDLATAGDLWKCPDGIPSHGTCGYEHCMPGSGDNPQCIGNLTDEQPCCCPKEGCYATPRFNQIIGVCRGDSCACGDMYAPSCAMNGHPDKCDDKCNGTSVRCCFGNNVEELVSFYNSGSRVTLNYLAAFEFDASTKQWIMQAESSFNTDGTFPPYNLTEPYGGIGKDNAWLAPQPGGSSFWGLGYYAAGVPGVGATDDTGSSGAAMFVMSTEEFWGATWYMLNQLTLDRGPEIAYPQQGCAHGNDNCWASGNAGEMDFLEPAWNRFYPNTSSAEGYTQSYSTQWNQIGRCFNGGINSGGFESRNYLLTAPENAPEPIVYVAVVDSVGNYVYRIPAAKAESIWPGISRKTITSKLQHAPSLRPASVNPCREDYCVVFTSNCQAHNVTSARTQECGFNGDQGFCGNWMQQLSDTEQPCVPSDDCIHDVRGGVTMPWCKEMVP
eukprot:m.288066 g.288066  ORF g.288066 m.288066 type:complete len:506 (-) comp19954_c0_seq4:193-1710(-)